MISRLLIATVFSMVMFSCSGGASKCVPGDSKACVGPAGCSGGQVCSADGTMYGACNCGGTGGGSAGLGGGFVGAGGGAFSAGGGTAAVGGGSGGGTTTDGGGVGGASSDAGTPCDAYAQTGCNSGQRCTWINVSDGGFGSVGCIAQGTLDAGAPCVPSNDLGGPATDACKGASYCSFASGVCEALCLPDSVNACATGFSCALYADLFGDNGNIIDGLCDPSCNPVTQRRLFDDAEACGSPNPANPEFGCYGGTSFGFTCARVLSASNTTNADITQMSFLNACAAGFYGQAQNPSNDGGQETQPIFCEPFCQPAPTSSTNPANAGGRVDSGFTCANRAAPSPFECRYLSFFDMVATDAGNTYGQCLDYTAFKYDSDNDGTLDKPYPSCTTLSASGHTFDPTLTDTQVWGCEPAPP